MLIQVQFSSSMAILYQNGDILKISNANKNRVASGPGISGNLEKSGNFMALEKCQGEVREFHEIWKSQGI